MHTNTRTFCSSDQFVCFWCVFSIQFLVGNTTLRFEYLFCTVCFKATACCCCRRCSDCCCFLLIGKCLACWYVPADINYLHSSQSICVHLRVSIIIVHAPRDRNISTDFFPLYLDHKWRCNQIICVITNKWMITCWAFTHWFCSHHTYTYSHTFIWFQQQLDRQHQ